MTRLVLAYSGSPASKAALEALVATGFELVTLTLDVGQGGDLSDVRTAALRAGAVRAHVLDARESLAAEVFVPLLSAGAFGTRRPAIPVSSTTRPIVAKHLVELARLEGTTRVAHGAVGPAAPALDRLITALEPAIAVVSSGAALLQPVESSARRHLLGRIAGPSAPAHRPGPLLVTIEFDAARPVRVNGVAMGLVELIESVATIADPLAVSRSGEAPSGAAVTMPAATLLGRALEGLVTGVLGATLEPVVDAVAHAARELLVDGRWFSPARLAVGAAADGISRFLSGVVSLERSADGVTVVLPERVANAV